MKTALESMDDLEYVISELRKIDAYIDCGRIVRAYRENRRILAFFIRERDNIMAQNKLNENKAKES